jgi:3-oxoacyl-[acyl-carrier protein] reductase
MKTVLITGASRGIGKACAEKFASLGYNVAVNYKSSKEQAYELCHAQIERGLSAKPYFADVSSASDVKKMFDEINKDFGGVDILINNAGISLIKVINDVSQEEWDKIFAVNAKSAFLCSKEALSHMLQNKWGRIINVSSMWGISGASCEVPYSASKAALIGFTKALAKELAPSGITVNCIAPGIIDTQMNSVFSAKEISDFVREIPLLRMGAPDEIAHCAAFFADEKSSYITGQVLSCDGGYTV